MSINRRNPEEEAAPKVFDSAGGGTIQFENQPLIPSPEALAEQERQRLKVVKIEEKARSGARIIIGAMVLAAVAITILIVSAILNSRDRVILQLGDFYFTERDVKVYEEAMQEHMDANPDITFGDDLRQVALDELTWNTALKYYASPEQCGVTVTAGDVLQANNISFDPGDDISAETMLRARFGEPSKSNFNLVPMENTAYKQKLNDCLIEVKEVFMMSIMYITQYFINLPEDQLQGAFDAARARLSDDILPLFEQGLPMEEIATRADVNIFEPYDPNLTDEELDRLEEEGYERSLRQAILLAVLLDVDSDAFFNEIPQAPRPELGALVSLNDAVSGLSEIGQYTDVLTTSAGNFVIARLEGKRDGLFSSWADFFGQMRDKSNIPRGMLASFPSIQMSQLGSLLVEDAYAATMSGDCSCGNRGHTFENAANMHFNITFQVEGGGQISEAVTVNQTVSCTPQASCSWTSSNGVIRTFLNCMSFNNYSATLPEGFEVVGVSNTTAANGITSVSFSGRDVSFRNRVLCPASGAAGCPANTLAPSGMVGQINFTARAGDVVVTVRRPTQWNLIGFSQVGSSGSWCNNIGNNCTRQNPLRVPVGTPVQFRHRVQNVGGTPVTEAAWWVDKTAPAWVPGGGSRLPLNGLAVGQHLTWMTGNQWSIENVDTSSMNGGDLICRKLLFEPRSSQPGTGAGRPTPPNDEVCAIIIADGVPDCENAAMGLSPANQFRWPLGNNPPAPAGAGGRNNNGQTYYYATEAEARAAAAASSAARGHCVQTPPGGGGGSCGANGDIEIFVWDDTPGQTNHSEGGQPYPSGPTGTPWVFTEQTVHSSIFVRPGSQVRFNYWADASAWVQLYIEQSRSNCVPCGGYRVQLRERDEAMNCHFLLWNGDTLGGGVSTGLIDAPISDQYTGSWNGKTCLETPKDNIQENHRPRPNEMTSPSMAVTQAHLGRKFRQEGEIFPSRTITNRDTCLCEYCAARDDEGRCTRRACSVDCSQCWNESYDGPATSWAEAKVPFNYQTNPMIRIDRPGAPTAPGTATEVEFSVTNVVRPNDMVIRGTPYSTDSYPTNHRVVSFMVAPGQNPYHIGANEDSTRGLFRPGTPSVSNEDVCAFYTSRINYTYNGADLGCIGIAEGDNHVLENNGGKIHGRFGGLYAHDAPPGTQVCYALTYWPASSWGRRHNLDNQGTRQANDEATSVTPNNSYRWWSEPQCYTIGKVPTVQVLGAGLNVPGNISTGQTIKSFGRSGTVDAIIEVNTDPASNAAIAILTDTHRRIYGSWSQFEIVAGRNVRTVANGLTGMASGSAFGSYGLCVSLGIDCVAGAGGGSRPDAQEWSRQTITNNGSDALGGYERTLLPTIETRLAVNCTPDGSTDLINHCSHRRDLSNLQPHERIERGELAVHVFSGNAMINGNIIYRDGSFNGPGELPQAIIVVNGDLTISANVTQIDAWVIVNGTLNTCWGFNVGTSGINSAPGCNSKLVFNGAVSAGNIRLNRTGGAGVNNSLRPSGCTAGIDSSHQTGQTVYHMGNGCGRDASGDPAEVFNLRGDAFLWAYYQSLKGGQASTTYVREVSPRF